MSEAPGMAGIDRRRLLQASGGALLGALIPGSLTAKADPDQDGLRLFLCGDVMTGRGIDQVLPHPGNPRLHERYAKDAERYVELAESSNGRISKPVGFSYVWGDAMRTLAAADLKVINLETTVSQSGTPYPKEVHYRMHPRNIACITEAGIDCCVLANNHALDWGEEGLQETLDTLHTAHVQTTGAGRNLTAAARPAICQCGARSRVLVFGFGYVDSGIPRRWAASEDRMGVNMLTGKAVDVAQVSSLVRGWRKPRDIVVASIHWGSNWGYRIPSAHRELARAIIDRASVDVVHGHSSHHVRGIEVHRGKLILYGCGDFINDYEGIAGHEEYRSDLRMAYSVFLRPADGTLERLEMTPFQMRRFRLNRASKRDVSWLRDLLVREGKSLGTSAEITSDQSIVLRWTGG